MMTSLQVLSGKEPWSEVRGDMGIVLRLAKGDKPGRPESRMLTDWHWNLIQDCWSAIAERPAAKVIISTIEHFLSHGPQSPPLCDVLPAWSNGADLGVESLLPTRETTEGSRAQVTQAGSDESDQNRYVVYSDAYLTPIYHIDISPSTPIRIALFSDVPRLSQPRESEEHRISLAGKQSGFRASSAAEGGATPP